MMVFRRASFVVALLVLAACNQKADTASNKHGAPITAVSTRDWSQVITATPEGGFAMGNPAAKVKLIEFGSLTCPHCAAFAKEGAPKLVAQYVKPGLVSYEFRNFARDPIDLAVSLLARCGGPKPFFGLVDQFYADQDKWIANYQKLKQADYTRINALPAGQMMAEIAKVGGLDHFVAMRGIPSARAQKCLSDSAAQDKIAAIRAAAINQYDVEGTPTFVINGKKADNVYDWTTLEPALQQALGS